MGIKYLNSYIKQHTTNKSINKINLSSLYGKTIVIDTSIYLYRFLMDETLLENMYIMISSFRYYNITPIFIFDGKSPIEKSELIKKRLNDKNLAEKQYNHIKQTIQHVESTQSQRELYNTMKLLKKKFVRLKRTDYIKVIELIDAFGVTYIEANGEADALCAKLVIKKFAYACLSEDMDLFVYGCPRVLRYLSLINNTVVIYHLNNILQDLNLAFKEFKDICVLSGTDYHINVNNDNILNLYQILKYFELYKNSNDYNNIDFYEWVDANYKCIENIYKLYDISNMFLTKNITLKKNIILKKNKVKIKKQFNFEKIKEIMKPEGFIFLEEIRGEVASLTP